MPHATQPTERGHAALIRLVQWAAVMALLIAADSLAVATLGIGFGLASDRGEGRIVLMFLAAGVAMQFMTRSLTPLAAYGMSTAAGWRPTFLVLALASAGCASLVVMAGIATGRLALRPGFGFLDAWDPALTALIAGALLAYVQEIVYRGFVLTELRRATGWAALPLAALFFGVTLYFVPHLWADPATLLPAIVGLTLAGLVLGLARDAFGSLTAPMAMVTGWVAVGIFVKRAGFVDGAGEAPWLWIAAPDGAPVLRLTVWAGLIGLAVLFALMARRRRMVDAPRPAAPAPQADGLWTRIARYNPFSSVMAFAQLDVFLKALVTARGKIGLAYLPRFLVMLILSAITTLADLPERLVTPLIRRVARPKDPVVILGVHRSGTTHLHTLLALDPRFVAPTTGEVFNPMGVLLVGRVVNLLVAPFLPWKRPFDDVELTFATPNEDEFALSAMTTASPYWSSVFPNARDHFDRYIFGARYRPAEKRAWQAALRGFLAKITLFNGKRPVLKSPYHTGKVGLFHETFPDVRFVHIRRDPRHVYRSNVKLERDGLSMFGLQTPEPDKSHAVRFLNGAYLAIEEACAREIADLPNGRIAYIRYEDLVADPIREIERLYQTLGLNMTEAFRARLAAYLSGRGDYRLNVYRKPSDTQNAEVEARLGPLLDRWGYR